MCHPAVAAVAAIAGTASSMKASKEQGKAINEAAQLNAKQALIEREQSKLEVNQFVNDRLEDLDNATDTNNAMFGFLGRDMDASINAFRESEKATAFKDIDRAIVSGVVREGQSVMSAGREIQRGKNALAAGKINSVSMMSSGIYSLSKIGWD
tara:strand:+ start:406 stop:864 length:459 start_codon:yes stop_codon:yes gene_type:complete